MSTEKREPLVGYVVIDEYADDMSHWDGAIAYPNPQGANLFWEKPEPFIQKSAYDEALNTIAELKEKLGAAERDYKWAFQNYRNSEEQLAKERADRERLFNYSGHLEKLLNEERAAREAAERAHAEQSKWFERQRDIIVQLEKRNEELFQAREAAEKEVERLKNVVAIRDKCVTKEWSPSAYTAVAALEEENQRLKERVFELEVKVKQLQCPHSYDVMGVCEWCGTGSELYDALSADEKG